MMLQKKYLILLSLLLALSSCSLFKREAEVVTVTEFIERDISTVAHPKPIDLYDVNFYVVTEKNFEEFKERFVKENGVFTFYAVSVRDYEALSLNVAELERYIKQQHEIILYYERAISDETHETEDN